MTRQRTYSLMLTPMLYALTLAMGGCLTAKREIVVVEPGVPIRIVQTVSVRAEVVAAARSRLAATSLVFYVDTLEHLRRGGRIGAAAALLGSALAIKPILTLTEGHIAPLEKVRTSTKAIARLEELSLAAVVAATPAGCDITVHHVGAPERAEAVADWLVDRTPADAAVTVAELGAVVGAHTGPGTLAVVVAPRVDAESA